MSRHVVMSSLTLPLNITSIRPVLSSANTFHTGRRQKTKTKHTYTEHVKQSGGILLFSVYFPSFIHLLPKQQQSVSCYTAE